MQIYNRVNNNELHHHIYRAFKMFSSNCIHHIEPLKCSHQILIMALLLHNCICTDSKLILNIFYAVPFQKKSKYKYGKQ